MAVTQEVSRARMLRYVSHRVRTAVGGTVLAVALFLATIPPWVSSGSDRHWNLWELYAAVPSGITPPVDSEQAWGRWMALFLMVTLVLALVTAAEAAFPWSVAAGIAAVWTFVFGIIFRLGARDNLAGSDYLYATGGAGWTAAMWITAVLAAWAAITALLAWDLRRTSG